MNLKLLTIAFALITGSVFAQFNNGKKLDLSKVNGIISYSKTGLIDNSLYPLEFEIINSNSICIDDITSCDTMLHTVEIMATLNTCVDSLNSFDYKITSDQFDFAIKVNATAKAHEDGLKIHCFAPTYIHKTITFKADRLDFVQLINTNF